MGLTVLDAGVVIGFLEEGDAHHGAAVTAITAAAERYDRVLLPASAYAEMMVGPARAGGTAVTTISAFLDRLPIHVEPLDASIAGAAARLRAEHPAVKLPDALVLATAIALDADRLVSTDRRWPSRSKLGLRAKLDIL